MRLRSARFARPFCAVLVALFALAFSLVAAEAQQGRVVPPLAERLTPEVMAAVYPNAARLGEVEGVPPSIAVYEAGSEEPAAYIFSTYDVVRAPGYSSYVFDVIAGVTPAGAITGAVVIDHREPHIRGEQRREMLLEEFLASHAGYSVSLGQGRLIRPDFVAEVTVSARAMRSAVLDSARFVLQARSGREPVTEPTLDRETFWPMTFDELVAGGSVAFVQVTNAEVAAMIEAAGVPEANLPRPLAAPDDVYTEVGVGLGSVMAIARNMLARSGVGTLAEGPGMSEPIIIGSNGRYGVLGSAYNSAEQGYRFDRFRIVQGEEVFELIREDFAAIIVAGAKLRNSGAFFVPATRFDPLQPFTVEFYINTVAPDGTVTPLTIPIEYQLPERHVLMPPAPPVPAYVEAWTEARTDIVILIAMLTGLTLILAFQGFIARHRRVFNTVRNAFLLFTLVWLGWTAGAQLSTIHLINYATAPVHDFGVGFYLSEPLIVIIAAYSLVALVILGRGVFCGWLCPFGALQELLAKVARALRLPQWNPSDELAKKLWVGKYIAAVLVIGATFTTPEIAAASEEIEPFRTAITSLFTRAWPFELYAVGLLVLGLFTERAYCRFLCPLGGTLAALDRLHLVDVLKRRPECGTPCKLCEHSCPVKAIDRSGRINMAECFQCLDCQVEYYDDHRCPPLAKVRKQLARASRPTSRGAIPVPAMARGAAVA